MSDQYVPAADCTLQGPVASVSKISQASGPVALKVLRRAHTHDRYDLNRRLEVRIGTKNISSRQIAIGYAVIFRQA
jgi:hypothetical protein